MVSLKKLGVGAGVGVLDIALEKVNEAMGLKFPMDALTIGRAGLFAVGLVANAFDKGVEFTEPLWIAEEPLLIRSIAKAGGLIADYQMAPSREAIELRLRSQGQVITPPRGPRAQFR